MTTEDFYTIIEELKNILVMETRLQENLNNLAQNTRNMPTVYKALNIQHKITIAIKQIILKNELPYKIK